MTSTPPAPTPSAPPRPRVSTLLMHLLLPGQAFSGRGQPLARWGWTLFGLLAMNFISFNAFLIGDRLWLLLWPVVAGAAAWHFFRSARPQARPARGELLYALAALFAWTIPVLLNPFGGTQREATLRRETALATQMQQKLTGLAVSGPLSLGPCPAEARPATPEVVSCEVTGTDPDAPAVRVAFRSGRTVELP